jgi:hypothetical protein
VIFWVVPPAVGARLVDSGEIRHRVERVGGGEHARAQRRLAWRRRRLLRRVRRRRRSRSLRLAVAPPHRALRHRGARLERHRLAARCARCHVSTGAVAKWRSKLLLSRTDEHAVLLARAPGGALPAQRQRALIQPPHALRISKEKQAKASARRQRGVRSGSAGGAGGAARRGTRQRVLQDLRLVVLKHRRCHVTRGGVAL